MNVTLISGRSLGQAKSKVTGKFTEEYLRNVAVCELHPEDLKALGIAPGQNVRVSTKSGTVVARSAVASQASQRGVVFMPYGPWVNMVVPSETSGTGMPSLKGIEAEVTAAPNEKLLDLRSLVEQMTSGR